MLTKKFQDEILSYYRKKGRIFPWRETCDPYRILVSEVMLQQTQAPRVVTKFHQFIKRFPTVRALAKATLSEVLRVWSGLGYNRRARYLLRAARSIEAEHGGTVPRTVAALRELPGIGHATACAVAVYAFNQPEVFIETNIRTVYLHFFFRNKKKISDNKIFPLVRRTLYRKNPRLWYWALMDYGTMLKKHVPNPSRRSRHYFKQGRFDGSTRQLRGKIVRQLLTGGKRGFLLVELSGTVPGSKQKTRAMLARMVGEGMVRQYRKRFFIGK